ncbi:hypothetical protein GS597_04285 [Synechococcales cyanobacterium C]|uniref:Uncharacterized protein n=1 Tax=Petrachloros mirabilis ULC683 TaxID=2781853 RepID=A0A8K1ZXB8_9CYAN|nr:hypothetical protein [Petrachloros mirabilis]NCJ05741.1 hypothetical protein [Petrachloros mirabilis ULC683]
MAFISKSTQRRLQKLKPAAGPWECDRTPLPQTLADQVESGDADEMDWVFCVDDQSMVRAIDLVPHTVGHEGIVRSLIQAMERPKGPISPARPTQILVRDREVQFFLRGALQTLDISVNYVPNLPYIDAIRSELLQSMAPEMPALPEGYGEKLTEFAQRCLTEAYWDYLEDHQILEVSLKVPEPQTFYLALLGFLGVEYGILLYRSLESLRQFRTQAIATDTDQASLEEIEAAFLSQDCLFLNFEDPDDRPKAPSPVLGMSTTQANLSQLRPAFGSIHPLEGVRPFLDDVEAQTMLLVLEALHRFFQRYYRRFIQGDEMPDISKRFQITLPELPQKGISVQVRTLPQLSEELYNEIEDEDPFEDEDLGPPIGTFLRDDLVPQGAMVSLGMIPWTLVSTMRLQARHVQPGKAKEAGDGYPAVVIQTSLPKAKALVQMLEAAGGVQAMGFAAGEDGFGQAQFDLGVIQLKNGQYSLFGEYAANDTIHAQARKKWDRRIQQTQGWSVLMIARGISGATRGSPKLKDVVALYEAPACTGTEMGLELLARMRRF